MIPLVFVVVNLNQVVRDKYLQVSLSAWQNGSVQSVDTFTMSHLEMIHRMFRQIPRLKRLIHHGYAPGVVSGRRFL